jgi:hypothetical protein
MSAEDFCFWLKGYLETMSSDGLTPSQVENIKEHLDDIWHPVVLEEPIPEEDVYFNGIDWSPAYEHMWQPELDEPIWEPKAEHYDNTVENVYVGEGLGYYSDQVTQSIESQREYLSDEEMNVLLMNEYKKHVG